MADDLEHTGGGGEGRGAGASRSKLPLLALAALLALGAARDAALVLRHPVAVGTDGYYYVLQVNELLTHGRLYYPTSTPLVFYLLAAADFLTGDVVSGVKVGSVLIHALLCLGVYALVASITGDRRLGVLGCAIAAFSGMHLYMIAEFVKNSAALAMLIWAAYGAIHAARGRRRAGWAVLSAALAVGALLCHKSAWALTLAAPPLALLSHLLTAPGRERRRATIAWAAIIFLGVLPWLVAVQPFAELPAWLAKELLARPGSPLSLADPVGSPERLALLLAAPAALFLLARRRAATHSSDFPTRSTHSHPHASHFRIVICVVALWTLLVTLNPFLVHDVRQSGAVGRLDHLSYLQAAVLLPGLAWLAARFGRGVASVLLLATLAVLAASIRSSPPKGLQPEFLSGQERLLAALPGQRGRLGKRPFVLARHGDEFVVTWVLGVPAQQKFPQDSDGRSIHWLLRRVPCRTLTDEMSAVSEEGFDSCSAFVGDEELSQWLGSIGEAGRAGLLVVNPHLRKHLKASSTPSESRRM